MSVTSIPFQGQTAADEAPGAPGPVESGGNKNMLVVLGGLAVVLVLGVVAYFLLFAGGDVSGDAATPAAAAPPAAAAAPAPADEVAQTPAKQAPIRAKSFGRDPFKALIVEPVVAPVAPVATDTTGGGTAATGSTPAVPEPGSPSSTAYRFQVVDVATGNKTIDVKVDGKAYNSLGAGDVFAEIFKVRFIGGASNSFQIGDEVFNVVGSKAVTISG